MGIDAGADAVWQQEGGMTVFAPLPADSEYGRFARIHHPEGLPIELWEPAG